MLGPVTCQLVHLSLGGGVSTLGSPSSHLCGVSPLESQNPDVLLACHDCMVQQRFEIYLAQMKALFSLLRSPLVLAASLTCCDPLAGKI